MRRLAINSGDAFILVYSVDDPNSFKELETLRETILMEREQAYLDTQHANKQTNVHNQCQNKPKTGVNLKNNEPSYIVREKPKQQYEKSRQNITTNNTGNYDKTTANPNCHPLLMGKQKQHQQQQLQHAKPVDHRHWSLASLFNNQHQNQLTMQRQDQRTSLTNKISHCSDDFSQKNTSSLGSSLSSSNHSVNQLANCGQSASSSIISNNNNSESQTNNQLLFVQSSQLSSNITTATATTSSSTCSSLASRRSSVSAAEAALRTRRTRHPPMVIVANKQDLPECEHRVQSDEIEALVVIDWNNGFVRASAAYNWNIKRIFRELISQAKQPPTLGDAIVGKRRKSLPPKLPAQVVVGNKKTSAK